MCCLDGSEFVWCLSPFCLLIVWMTVRAGLAAARALRWRRLSVVWDGLDFVWCCCCSVELCGLVSCVCARNGCVRDVLPLLCVYVLCELLASGCFVGTYDWESSGPFTSVFAGIYSERLRLCFEQNFLAWGEGNKSVPQFGMQMNRKRMRLRQPVWRFWIWTKK